MRITRRDAGLMLGTTAMAASVPAIGMPTSSGERAAKQATYVLVHGAGGGGWCWERMAPYLLAEGHRVYSPSLTGAGDRWHLISPQTGLDTQIEDIVSLLKWENLSNVILVGHSYGGMVITGMADRALEKIGQLVYLDAAHPINGESLADVAPATVGFAQKTLRVVNGVEVVGAPRLRNGRASGHNAAAHGSAAR